MKILVLNCRIYSVEFELIEMPAEKVLAKGAVAKIGLKTGIINYDGVCGKRKRVEPIMDHHSAIHRIIEILHTEVLKDISQIKAVGHRVVHGGDVFYESVIIDSHVKEEIKRNIELAPLHNPYNLKGIEAIENLLPEVLQIAVFGTAFYRKMPARAHYYAIPKRLVQQYGIKRYGFHGISNQYCLFHTAKLLKKPANKLKVIICHLGYGASVTAIKNGIPQDTSMGFSPLGGVPMSTRSGNIDPEILIYLMHKGWSLNEISICLNRESGILGVSGISDDMREIIAESKKGNKNATLAIEIFCFSIQKYIGAYYAVLGGADAISFTAGIGVNSPFIRRKICGGLEAIGVSLDGAKNRRAVNREMKISGKNSKIAVFTVPRNEILLIARETAKLLNETAEE
ncbi:MAG: acetate kinase [Elusimicrobia bacterium]|nr:acetate kinase [Elusimicrobiota bacterium]